MYAHSIFELPSQFQAYKALIDVGCDIRMDV